MEPAQHPTDEAARLENLRSFGLLDTPPEEQFNELTDMAARVCEAPLAMISLVDAKRQWFKSSIGIEICETDRDVSFCGHAILGTDVFEIPDTHADPRFCDNPLVTGEPGIRFYAGAPLRSAEGFTLGALCVIDRVPRKLNPSQRELLMRIARRVVNEMTIRRQARLHARDVAFMQAMLNSAGAGIIATNIDGLITHFNPAAERLLGYSAGEVVGQIAPDRFHDRQELETRAKELTVQHGSNVKPDFEVFKASLQGIDSETREWTYIRKDGGLIPVLLTLTRIIDAHHVIIGYLGVARDILDRKRAETRLRFSEIQKTEALAIIKRQHELQIDLHAAQDLFISQPNSSSAFDQLLSILIRQTGTDYGFIGEVLRDDRGQPYLKTHAITNIAWSPETRALYEAHKQSGMTFFNLKSLFGAVMTTKEPVISNDPGHDLRRCGLPHGHPRMDNFLGLPIKVGGELIGMVGVANRTGGFDESIIYQLEPLLLTYGNLIQARRNLNSRLFAEQQLRENEARLQRVMAASGLGYWDYDAAKGALSGDWPKMLGYDPSVFPGTAENWASIVHPDDAERVFGTWKDLLEGRITLHVVEYRGRSASGEWRWVLCEGRVIARDDKGQPLTAAGTFKDIHDRKALEQQSAQLVRNRVLLQEVHHRIKNNLQIVSSLLAMQQRQTADPTVSEQLQLSRNRVSAVAVLHELLYRSDEMDTVALGDLVKELSRQVFIAFGMDPARIQLDLQCEALSMDYTQAGSVALILNELLTNSLKHAFPSGNKGTIAINLSRAEREGWARLEIRDDGVGAPRTAQSKPNGSLGMLLVKRLTEQLQAVLTPLELEKGTGWRLEVQCKA